MGKAIIKYNGKKIGEVSEEEINKMEEKMKLKPKENVSEIYLEELQKQAQECEHDEGYTSQGPFRAVVCNKCNEEL